MFLSSKIKFLKSILTISLATLGFYSLSGYADSSIDISPIVNSIDKLEAGYGQIAIKNNNPLTSAPANDDLTIAINTSQANYLLFPSSPLVSMWTQNLLKKSASLDDNNNNIFILTRDLNTKRNPNIEKNPLGSIDINTLLQPLVYTDTEATEAKNVINALNYSLAPIQTVNLDQMAGKLRGIKDNNLNIILKKKSIQEYLATLRSYLAIQSVALSNLNQLYAERQPVDSAHLPSTLKDKTSGPYSLLKLENFMSTRRILNKDWYINDLIHESPATLQRQQVELLAENLAESYHTRMTLERLLATMSVLVLELNNQGRTQLIQQAQNINNPNSTSG